MFRDRTDAGRLLAEIVASRLGELPDLASAGGVVMGLPRGGVPVAAVVAEALGLPLDVLIVRKLGVPWQPELALGAVGEGGVVVLNDDVVLTKGVGCDTLDALVRKASQELDAMVADLRPAAGPPVSGRLAIVVDDGVATGATAKAAASVLRHVGAGSVILATPVAPPSVCASLRSHFDEVICLRTPSRFTSVGRYYEQFGQVSIAEVRRLL